MAYENFAGPLGPRRSDQQAAVIAWTIASVMTGKGKKFKIEDFIPTWGPKPEKAPEELLAAVIAINAAFGGEDLRGDS